MNSSFRDGTQFAWDSTSIKLAETCLRKYKYKMLDGWQPRRKSVHLLFGGWYATALEHYHKYIALGDTEDEALIKVVRETLISTWEYETEPTEEGDDGYPEGVNIIRGTGKPWETDHPAKTRENLIRTIVWYVDHFRSDPVKVYMKADGTPAVEFSFSFEVDHGIFLSGHIDRLVEYSGQYYVMDQKTSGSTITQNYFENFDPDTQMSLYTLAGKIIYDKPVKGVIIDAAQIAVGFTRFTRGFTHRDEAKLDDWYEGALYTIERAQVATQENYFPGNPSACGNFGGCEFRNVCSRTPSIREAFLSAEFVRGEIWDPLKRR